MSQGTNQKHMVGGGVLIIFADINLRPFPVPSTQKQMCLICFVMLFKMELSAYPNYFLKNFEKFLRKN